MCKPTRCKILCIITLLNRQSSFSSKIYSNLIDDYNRESLATEVDFSLPLGRVMRNLNQVIEWRGNLKSFVQIMAWKTLAGSPSVAQ